MGRIGSTIALGILPFCLGTGCGTMANLDGRDTLIGVPTRPPIPFGGVANDVEWMKHANLSPPEKFDRGFAFAIGMSDLPLSLVGDVVTLPWASFVYTREKLMPSDQYEKWKKINDGAPSTSGPIPDASDDEEISSAKPKNAR